MAARGERWKLLVQCFWEDNHGAHRLCVITAIGHDIIFSSLLIHVQSCRINILIIVLHIILFFRWCWWEVITSKSHLSGSWAAKIVKCQDFFSYALCTHNSSPTSFPPKKNMPVFEPLLFQQKLLLWLQYLHVSSPGSQSSFCKSHL